jgi:hypothetical protein
MLTSQTKRPAMLLPLSPHFSDPALLIILRIPHPTKVCPKTRINRIPGPPIHTRRTRVEAAILFPRDLVANNAVT